MNTQIKLNSTMLKCNSTKIPEHDVKLEIISVSTYITIVPIKVILTGMLLVYYYRFFKLKNCKITYTHLHQNFNWNNDNKSKFTIYNIHVTIAIFFFFFAKTIYLV